MSIGARFTNSRAKRAREKREVIRGTLHSDIDTDDPGHGTNHSKTAETRALINASLESHFLFKGLDPQARSDAVESMQRLETVPGDVIIRQGDKNADQFYIIQDGSFVIDVDGEEVATYGPGQNFGELALLYSAPRAASVIAETDGVLWSLHRCFFRTFIKSSAKKKRGETEKCLMSVPEFRPPRITMEDLRRLSDAMRNQSFAAGADVVRQGEKGSDFFLIIAGSCAVAVDAVRVGTMNAGDYFGERALLDRECQLRTATVTAEADCECLVLGEEDFRSLVELVGACLFTTLLCARIPRCQCAVFATICPFPPYPSLDYPIDDAEPCMSHAK
jgi:cAMP-dependent protein kinase regulator